MFRPSLLPSPGPARPCLGLRLCLPHRPAAPAHRGFASSSPCLRLGLDPSRSRPSHHPPLPFPSFTGRLPASALSNQPAASSPAASPPEPPLISKSAQRKRRVEVNKGRHYLGRNVTIITKPPPEESLPASDTRSSAARPRGSSRSRFAPPDSSAPSRSAQPVLTPAPNPDTFPTLHAATSLQPAPGAYYVRRTSSRGLPVYQRKKMGGNKFVTLIKRVEGNREAFRRELAVGLALEYKNVQENHVTGHIHIPGHMGRQVMTWLIKKGF